MWETPTDSSSVGRAQPPRVLSGRSTLQRTVYGTALASKSQGSCQKIAFPTKAPRKYLFFLSYCSSKRREGQPSRHAVMWWRHSYMTCGTKSHHDFWVCYQPVRLAQTYTSKEQLTQARSRTAAQPHSEQAEFQHTTLDSVISTQ